MPAANELVIHNEFDTDNWQLLNGTHTFGIDCIHFIHTTKNEKIKNVVQLIASLSRSLCNISD